MSISLEKLNSLFILSRRILHEIKILRTQLKYQSLEYINTNDYDTDAFSTIEQQYSRTLPHENSNLRREFSSYPNHQLRRTGSVETTTKNPYLEDELQTLLARKSQLGSRIHHLQQSREELTTQLDHLGRILRYSPHLQQRSAASSPHTRSTVSPSRMNSHTFNSKKSSHRSYSTPSTPVHNRLMNNCMINHYQTLSNYHFILVRTDLLLAADSLTSALSTLVQQLNTSTESHQTENEVHFYPYNNDH
jgi:hypothetical protein